VVRREAAAVGVDRERAAELEPPALHEPPTLALLAEAEVLQRHEDVIVKES